LKSKKLECLEIIDVNQEIIRAKQNRDEKTESKNIRESILKKYKILNNSEVQKFRLP
jgi:hypothetical protein